MLQIKDCIFSLDVLEKKFCCDLPKCHGSCCRYGDSGAPLTEEEVRILQEILPEINPFLRPECAAEIERQGTSIKDFENEPVTPLLNNEECVYTMMDGNIFLCAIEKAWTEGKTKFRKPASCHLFPLRIKKFAGFKAVNYQELQICSPAREKGAREGIYVYEFLKDPIIRVLGDDVYNDLCISASELKRARRNK